LTNSIAAGEFTTVRPAFVRNTLAIATSPDLRKWTLGKVLLHHPDIKKHAFQYVDWVFEGDDIIADCRTAYEDGLGGAHRYHDANYLTFHRFPNFRELTGKNSPPPPGPLKGRQGNKRAKHPNCVMG
jgi:hypothetical protein